MTHLRSTLVFIVTVLTGTILAATSLAGTAKQPTVKVAGPTYGPKTFKVIRCINKGETDLNLTGTAPGGDVPLRLRIVGKYRSGTLTIRGDINLDGKLTSIVVGDAGAVNVKGRFTTAGSKGPFTATGRCG